VHRANSFTWRLISAAILTLSAGAAHAEDWQFGLTPYLWLPNIEANGTADGPPNGGDPAYQVGPVDYLDNLDFVLMLAGEARRGSWSLRSDLIYLDFSNQRSAVKTVGGPGGVIEVPVDAGTTSSFTGLDAQATLGYWRSLNRSDGSVNSISSDAWSGLGRAPTFSDNLVEVARVN